MANLITVFQGDILTGTVSLRTIDQSNPDNQNPFPIPVGATITMFFPGTTSSVQITSGAGEVNVTNATLGDLSYTVSPAKTAQLKLGKQQAIDVVVTDASGNPTTFEIPSTLTVVTRANP